MNDVREFTVVKQNPAQGLGQEVEHFCAAFTPESQVYEKVISTLPGNRDASRVDGNDIKGTSDVCFGQPSSLT